MLVHDHAIERSLSGHLANPFSCCHFGYTLYGFRTIVRSQEMKSTTIAGLAREGGVGVETVRYYQRRGLLDTPEREHRHGFGGGVRRYGDQDVRKLRFIRSAQAAGFTLEEIAELLK